MGEKKQKKEDKKPKTPNKKDPERPASPQATDEIGPSRKEREAERLRGQHEGEDLAVHLTVLRQQPLELLARELAQRAALAFEERLDERALLGLQRQYLPRSCP